MRDIRTLPDANVAIRELNDRVESLFANVVDFKGRRITNAAPSKSLSDYVTQEELIGLNTRLLAEIDRLKQRIYILEKP